MNTRNKNRLIFALVTWITLSLQGFSYVVFKMGPFDLGSFLLIVVNLLALWGMVVFARLLWGGLSSLLAVLGVLLYEAIVGVFYAVFLFMCQFLGSFLHVFCRQALLLISSRP